jgi:hypothetical protein
MSVVRGHFELVLLTVSFIAPDHQGHALLKTAAPQIELMPHSANRSFLF